MYYEKNYYDDELTLRFISNDKEEYRTIDEKLEISVSKNDPNNAYYGIDFIKSEKTKILINKKFYSYNEPILVLKKPKSNLYWNCYKGPYSFLTIRIHPLLFNNIPDIDKTLMCFFELKDGENIFKLNSPKFVTLVTCLDLIQAALFAKCGRFSIESRVKTLISELSLIYETNYKEYVASTDSISAQVLDYIEKHYLEKITLKTISDKFYISFNTINSIVKKLSGKTFKEYLTILRLDTANALIRTRNYPLASVAKLSGFSDYSAFIRTYKKYYGISPSQALKENH